MGVLFTDIDPSLVPISKVFRFHGESDYVGDSKIEIRQADCTIPYRTAIPCSYTHTEKGHNFLTEYYNLQEEYIQFCPKSDLRHYLSQYTKLPFDFKSRNEVSSIAVIESAILELCDIIPADDDLFIPNKELIDLLGVESFVESDLPALLVRHVIPLRVIRRFKRVTRTPIKEPTQFLINFPYAETTSDIPADHTDIPANQDLSDISDTESIVTLPMDPWN
jgi:hypothetical protein